MESNSLNIVRVVCEEMIDPDYLNENVSQTMPCNKCKKEVKRKHISDHMKLFLKTGGFHCGECKKSFLHHTRLLEHCAKKHQQSIDLNVCEECGKSFSRRAAQMEHRKVHVSV